MAIERNNRLIKIASYASVTTAVVIMLAKSYAWLATESQSILASLIDSLLDISSSAINLIAIRFSLLPADDNHRFGHEKFQDLAIFAQSIFFFASCLFTLFSSSKALFSEPELVNLELGTNIMYFCVFLTFVLVCFQSYVVSKTKSKIIYIMKIKSLTLIERQILANQFRILSKVGNDAEQVNNIRKSIILENGYTGKYHEIFDVHEEEVPIEICNETSEILNMYRRINSTIGILTNEQKESLDLESIKFEGFDANNDKHYYYLQFLITELDLWQEHKDLYLNSHDSSTIIKYRQMLTVNNKLLKNNIFHFTYEHIIEFIEAIK